MIGSPNADGTALSGGIHDYAFAVKIQQVQLPTKNICMTIITV